MTDTTDIIRERIRARRIALNIDQSVLAQAAGISRSTFTNAEAGRSAISAEQLAAYAKVLRVPPGWFYGDEGPTEEEAMIYEAAQLLKALSPVARDHAIAMLRGLARFDRPEPGEDAD